MVMDSSLMNFQRFVMTLKARLKNWSLTTERRASIVEGDKDVIYVINVRV